MSLLLAALLQVGPAPSLPETRVIPPELEELRRRQRSENQPEMGDAAARIAACHARAQANPADAERAARALLDQAIGEARLYGQHCLGLALANRGAWSEAAQAFQTAYGLAATERTQYRARLAALAGNAWLAEGKAQRALDLLDAAREGAPEALLAEVDIDRARSLVALDRSAEAANALRSARETSPDNPLAWLLSATLSRRAGALVEAQQQIERAASLDPADAAIGLEAGVIAALAGRDEAARASWRSVLEIAPGSPAAATAQSYLDQLDGD